MSQEQKVASEQYNNSVDYTSLTQEFNNNLFITEKNDGGLIQTDVALEVNQSENQNNTNDNKGIKEHSHQDKPLQVLNITKKTKLVQKPINIIEVLSDDEEQKIFQQKIAQQKIKLVIEEAVLAGSKFNILKTLYKEYVLQEKSQLQKQDKFKGLILSYFYEKANINLKNGYFKNRKQSNKSEQFLQNQYILYGVDMISTNSLKKIFFNQHPQIKWIDSSHCKLIFDSKMLGWQAIVDNRNPPKEGKDDFQGNINLKTQQKLVYDDQMEYQEQNDNQIQAEIKQRQKIKKHFVLLKNYVELSPYYQLGFKRKLYIRNAGLSQITIQQQQQNQPQPQSRSIEIQENQQTKQKTQNSKNKDDGFSQFRQVKKSFQEKLMNIPVIKEKFQEIMENIQKDKLKRKKWFNSSFYSRSRGSDFKSNNSQKFYQRQNDGQYYQRGRGNWRGGNMNTDRNDNNRTRTRDQRRAGQTRQQRNDRMFEQYLKGKILPEEREQRRNYRNKHNQNQYKNQNQNYYYQQNLNYDSKDIPQYNQYNNQQYYQQYNSQVNQPQQFNQSYNQRFNQQQYNYQFNQAYNNPNYPNYNQMHNTPKPMFASNNNNYIPNYQSYPRQNIQNFGRTNQNYQNKKVFTKKTNAQHIQSNNVFKNNQSQQISYDFKDKIQQEKRVLYEKSLSQQFRSDIEYSNNITNDQVKLSNDSQSFGNNLGSLLNALDNEENQQAPPLTSKPDPNFSDDQSSDLEFIYQGANEVNLKLQNRSNQLINQPENSTHQQFMNQKQQSQKKQMKFEKKPKKISQDEKQQQKSVRPIKKKKIRVQTLDNMKPDGNVYYDLQHEK